LLKTPIQFEVDEGKAVDIARVLLDLIGQGHWLVSMPEYGCHGTFRLGAVNMLYT